MSVYVSCLKLGFEFCVLQLNHVLAGPDLHVYLLIHNIDGPMLRGEKTQSSLGQLASLPNLHLVASLDHINAPLGECFISVFTAVLIKIKCILVAESFPCVTQCGTSFSRASLTGCGGSV